MRFNEFKTRIENIYHNVFPNSGIDVYVFNCLGKSIAIKCHFAQNEKECTNGYYENDMFHIDLDIPLPKDFGPTDDLPETITLNALSKTIVVAPSNDLFWSENRNISFRRTSGDIDKILKTFEKFVNKLKETIKEEIEIGNIHKNFVDMISSKIT